MPNAIEANTRSTRPSVSLLVNPGLRVLLQFQDNRVAMMVISCWAICAGNVCKPGLTINAVELECLVSMTAGAQ